MAKKIIWQDLPKPENLFTARSAVMKDLDKNKIVQHYLMNTKISLAQKAQVGEKIYYRTRTAKEKGLNWAFEASAFGLPNDVAPLGPSSSHGSSSTINSKKSAKSTSKSTKKQKVGPKATPSKSGGMGKARRFWRRLFMKRKS